MSESRRTLTFGGAALALAAIALLTAPRHATPDALMDRGELFFPEFDNPNEAASLEVVAYDEETSSASAFKVTNQDERWTIPSHHGYPADGADRLAKTAAGVIGIRKDDFRSDNAADHEKFGVIDPLDETNPAVTGRGRRVTMRGANEQVLADFIVGKALEERDGFRFVRLPEQKRVYVAKMDIDISTKFEDWIERDLLQVDPWNIEEVVLRDYSIDERTLRVDERDTVTLTKKDGSWRTDRMRQDQEVAWDRMNGLLTALDDLKIVGVRPKPEGLSAGLKRVDQDGGLSISEPDLLSLQSKGYYFTRDGSLLSNEGELRVRTQDGILYTLRFGEIVYGQGEAISMGAGASDEEGSGPGENRYVFITAEFLEGRVPEPPRPAGKGFADKPEDQWTDEDRRNKEATDKHEEWAAKVQKARELADRLNGRFADWYYVIPSEAFNKVHLTRADLVTKKPAPAS
jgi:hypothetical protein